jgi:hypothetical protein
MLFKDGDLYVSAVEGHVVARFGSETAQFKPQQIGVYPVVKTRKNGATVFTGLRWDLDEVVRIPREEYLAHLKSYDNAVTDGALKVRTKEEYAAFLEAQAKRSDDEAKKAAADAKEAEEKAAAEAKKKAEEKAAADAAKTKAAAPAVVKKES